MIVTTLARRRENGEQGGILSPGSGNMPSEFPREIQTKPDKYLFKENEARITPGGSTPGRALNIKIIINQSRYENSDSATDKTV